MPNEVAKALRGDEVTYDEQDMEWLTETITSDLATANVVDSEGGPAGATLYVQTRFFIAE